MILVFLLAMLLSPVLADAATYYASTTGSGSTCSQASPCTLSGGVTKLAGGDTLLVSSGTYSIGSGIGINNPPSGTVNAYTVIKWDGLGTKPILDGGSTTNSASGFGVVCNTSITGCGYIEINGFEIKEMNQSIALIGNKPANTFTHHWRILNNVIHDTYGEGINQTAQVAGTFDYSHLISGNEFYNIGILHPGYTSGHNTIYFPGNNTIIEHNTFHNLTHAVGIWTSGAKLNNVVVRYNLFYDINRSNIDTWQVGLTGGSAAIHISIGGGGHKIYNNVIYNSGSTTAADNRFNGIQVGTEATASSITSTIEIYNNTCYGFLNAGSSGVRGYCFNDLSDTGDLVIKNNIAYQTPFGFRATGSTISNNLTSDPSFVNAASGDFSLLAGSAAINNGTASIAGRPCNGTCDQGAHETFTYASAKIDQHVLDVTLGMSGNVPVIVTTTGWSVRVDGVARTVLSAEKLAGADTVVRLTLTGAVCAGGETWDVSYAQTGATTDSALIGNTSNQELLAFTQQAVTNNCGTTPPADPGTPYIYYKFDEGTGTAFNDESANNLDGTLTNGGNSAATGKSGFGVGLTDQDDNYVDVPYGNTVNPSTQSLTICMGVKPDAGLEALTRTYFSVPLTASQNLLLSTYQGTWAYGIQATTVAVNTEFPVSAGWSYVCLVLDSGTDIATLYVNGVVGTSGASVRSYTSFAFTGNFRIGAGSGFGSTVYPGVTIDEFKVYQAALSAADILDLFEAFNPPAPPATGTFTQTTFKFQGLRKAANGDPIDLRPTGTHITSVPGGAFMLIIQTDCTVSNCDPLGQRLRYSKNSGSYLAVPDIFSTDNISFYGDTADTSVVSAAVSCCLSGALTANDGITVFTSDAIPSVDLAQNTSVVQRYVIKFDTDVTAGDTYDFRLYDQDGNVFSAYTATPRVTIVAMSMGVGF